MPDLAGMVQRLAVLVRQLQARVDARVYSSTNLAIPSGVGTVLPFNSERHNNGALHSTAASTSRLTAPGDGLYEIGCCVQWAANAAGIRQVFLRVNGTTTIDQILEDVDSAVNHTQNLSTEWELAAGDYVEVVVAQSSGGNLAVLANASFSPEFWMRRLAAS